MGHTCCSVSFFFCFIIWTGADYWILSSACARHGVHYVDLTGETPWVKRIIEKYVSSVDPRMTYLTLTPQIRLSGNSHRCNHYSSKRFWLYTLRRSQLHRQQNLKSSCRSRCCYRTIDLGVQISWGGLRWYIEHRVHDDGGRRAGRRKERFHSESWWVVLANQSNIPN